MHPKLPRVCGKLSKREGKQHICLHGGYLSDCFVRGLFDARNERGWVFFLIVPYIDSDWFSSLISLNCLNYYLPLPLWQRSFHHFCCPRRFVIYTIKSALPSWNGLPTSSNASMASLIVENIFSGMLHTFRDVCENWTWMPNICPYIHPAYEPFQALLPYSIYGHYLFLWYLLCRPWLRADITFADLP